jgi:GMP synthase (glutamine-hydrolysing)
MRNHRLITTFNDPKRFVDEAIDFLKRHANNKKVFCALSGGVDSSATYLLLKKANINTYPVFIDHGLMRIIKGKEEREHIKNIFPGINIVDIRNSFLPKIYGEGDAEKKRQLFKDAYSETISYIIKEQNCDLLADGTILPDIEESFGVSISDLKETMSLDEELDLLEKNKNGFVKSQHNLDIEYDVDATIQPVASLTKPEVREVLRFFNMPQELVNRKAFPGPALAARIVGPVNEENLKFEKKVHDIVESMVDNYYIQKYGKPMIINDSNEQEPFQVFAATIEDIINSEVTGLKNGKRTYMTPISVSCKWDYDKLVSLGSNIREYARVFYKLGENIGGTYDVVIRSINSIDARTATVTNLPIQLLILILKEILKVPGSRKIYFDVTPKPPGTIEYV